MEFGYNKRDNSNSLIKDFDEIVHLKNLKIIFLYMGLSLI